MRPQPRHHHHHHHERFRAAVLRALFPPPPLPSSPPQARQELRESVLQSCEDQEVHFSNDEDLEKPALYTGSGDEASISKQRLSRARRKRLRLKKLKESSSPADGLNTVRKPRFVGPLLPEPLPDEKKTPSQPGFDHDECDQAGISVLHDNERSKDNSKLLANIKPQEGERSTHECSTPFTEPIFLSKSRRRKLAKKGRQDCFENQRRMPIGMPFTADVRGHSLIINRFGEHAS